MQPRLYAKVEERMKQATLVSLGYTSTQTSDQRKTPRVLRCSRAAATEAKTRTALTVWYVIVAATKLKPFTTQCVWQDGPEMLSEASDCGCEAEGQS